jgi:hypothetical protein
MGSYSRTAYMAIKAEATENVAVTPDVFILLMSEDVVTEWGATPATPVSGNRSMNLRAIPTAIAPPSGTISLLAEPKTMGYFLKAVFGAVVTGRYFPISSLVGTFTVGETVTGGTSAATATVLAVSVEGDYLIMGSPTGTFTVTGEALTGGSSGATANLGVNAATVYGHEFKSPQSSLPTFTVEFGFDDKAYRYTGVRFNSFNSVAQEDNIITTELGFMARAEFKHAKVTAITSSGAGAKTITVDQTTGLAASDTVKVWRPSTGAFLDFVSAGVKTHTVNAVVTELTFTVTNLETALAVGDLVMLAPQTPTYTIDKEFSWIGGSTVKIADSISSALSASVECIEDFEIAITNELEARHCASGINTVNRFPSKLLLKGLDGNGSLTKVYVDDAFLNRLRLSTPTALQVKHVGGQIASTGVYYTLDWRIPALVFDAFNPSISEDDLLNQEMPYKIYYPTGGSYFAKALLINNVTSYA